MHNTNSKLNETPSIFRSLTGLYRLYLDIFRLHLGIYRLYLGICRLWWFRPDWLRLFKMTTVLAGLPTYSPDWPLGVTEHWRNGNY